MKKLGVSRRALYEQLDRPALRPLPVATRYVLAHWKPCRVNIDYHVTVEHHVYSVPYQLVREQVEVRYTTNTVEIFHRDKRMASHRRRYDRQPSTVAEHMPSAHRAHAEWSPSRLIGWANKIGPATGQLVTRILQSRPHPERGYRPCLGIMRLGRRHGNLPARGGLRPRAGARLLPLSHRQRTSSAPVRTVCPSSRRPRRTQRRRTPTSAAPTTTPPRPQRRTDADRTDARQAQRHEAGRDGRGLAATTADRRGRPRSVSRSVSACSSTPSRRPASSASCSGASKRRSCATRRRSKPSTLPIRAGSTASRSSLWAPAPGSLSATT